MWGTLRDFSTRPVGPPAPIYEEKKFEVYASTEGIIIT
jgi:hypothetical protein